MTTRRAGGRIALAAIAALTTVGLGACGTIAGTAHPAPVPVPVFATAPAADAAAPAPDGPTTADGRTGSGSAGGTGRGTGSGSGGGSGTGTSGGSGGGTSGGSGGSGTGGGTGSGAPAAPAAKITSFRVVSQPACAVRGTPDAPFSSPGKGVTIAWTVTGAKGAAIAVDNPDVYGAYGSAYPASGQLELPFTCSGPGTTTHTFTVWPAGAKGVSKTLTVSARSDG
jgi:hypothetical protein